MMSPLAPLSWLCRGQEKLLNSLRIFAINVILGPGGITANSFQDIYLFLSLPTQSIKNVLDLNTEVMF